VKATIKKKTAPKKKATARKPAKKTAKKTVKKAAKKTARRTAKKPAKKAKSTGRQGDAKQWTDRELKVLRSAYRTTPTAHIAKSLRRSLSSVRSKAVALSLKKTVIRKASPKKVAPRGKMRRCC
jgi:hypothetical protein